MYSAHLCNCLKNVAEVFYYTVETEDLGSPNARVLPHDHGSAVVRWSLNHFDISVFLKQHYVE